MNNTLMIIVLTFFLLAVFPGCNQETNDSNDIDEDVSYSLRHVKHAESGHAMVAGTFSEQAVEDGLAAIRNGGSAIDGVLTTVLSQIAYTGGSMISYAGILTIVYFDNESGSVYSLDGTYKVPSGEDDPLSILPLGNPDGRSALISGFMAAVQAAHDRFGVLSFGEIFVPAIGVAENGFNMHMGLAMDIESQWDVLSRLPETRRVFTKSNGERYQAGDHFVQPELAETLRKVVSEGAEYMYTGDWGQKFVEIVRREGGKINMADMESYRVDWEEPSHTTYNGFNIYSLSPISLGGVASVEAFNLLENSGLFGATQHYSESAELLYQFIMIDRIRVFLTYFPAGPIILGQRFPGHDFSLSSRLRKEKSRLIWELINSGEWHQIENEILQQRNLYRQIPHTAAVVAVDSMGNAAAVVHTINTYAWGTTGIFVDGVSIPDSGAIRQLRMASVGAGAYLPDNENPCLVTRYGRPFLVCGSTGGGQHAETIQNIYNILTFDHDPLTSLNTVKFLNHNDQNIRSHNILRHSFPRDILDAVRDMGQALSIVEYPNQNWVGIKITQGGEHLFGATSSHTDDCQVAGY